MFKVNAVDDVAGLVYIEGDDTGTDAGTIGDVDRPKEVDGPEKAKSKVNIITLGKTNMTSILVSY